MMLRLGYLGQVVGGGGYGSLGGLPGGLHLPKPSILVLDVLDEVPGLRLVELLHVRLFVRQFRLHHDGVVGRAGLRDQVRPYVGGGHPGEDVGFYIVARSLVDREYLGAPLLLVRFQDVEVGRQTDVSKKLVHLVDGGVHKDDESSCFVDLLYRLHVVFIWREALAIRDEEHAVRRLAVVGKEVYTTLFQIGGESLSYVADIVCLFDGGPFDHRVVVATTASAHEEDGQRQKDYREKKPAEMPLCFVLFHRPQHSSV